jgi:hypothetical protein
VRAAIPLLLVAAAAAPRVEAPRRVPLESRLLLRAGGASVMNGGYGSAVAAHPQRRDYFYFLADRGPNVTGTAETDKIFLKPSFAPQIALFRLEGGSLWRMSVIPLRSASGRPLTGLPNPPGRGGTGERSLDARGRELPTDSDGVDPEGLVALRDGGFWVSDEYGPHLLHVAASGRTLERISPFASSNGRRLPRVLARRRPNRGMEGLTITSDERTLVGLMQSPLDNPGPDVRKTARATRIVMLDLTSGAARQFVYLLERPTHSVTEIAAIDAESFLVIERDDFFAGDPKQPAECKRVYRIETRDATDIGPREEADPAPFGGRTLEQLDADALAGAGVRPVIKTLAVDLLKLPGGFPHDKPEGLTLVEGGIAVSNDDDFGVIGSGGKPVAKILPATGKPDRNYLYLIPLAR